jgi:hypothetical protein
MTEELVASSERVAWLDEGFALVVGETIYQGDLRRFVALAPSRVHGSELDREERIKPWVRAAQILLDASEAFPLLDDALWEPSEEQWRAFAAVAELGTPPTFGADAQNLPPWSGRTLRIIEGAWRIGRAIARGLTPTEAVRKLGATIAFSPPKQGPKLAATDETEQTDPRPAGERSIQFVERTIDKFPPTVVHTNASWAFHADIVERTFPGLVRRSGHHPRAEHLIEIWYRAPWGTRGKLGPDSLPAIRHGVEQAREEWASHSDRSPKELFVTYEAFQETLRTAFPQAEVTYVQAAIGVNDWADHDVLYIVGSPNVSVSGDAPFVHRLYDVPADGPNLLVRKAENDIMQIVGRLRATTADRAQVAVAFTPMCPVTFSDAVKIADTRPPWARAFDTFGTASGRVARYAYVAASALSRRPDWQTALLTTGGGSLRRALVHLARERGLSLPTADQIHVLARTAGLLRTDTCDVGIAATYGTREEDVHRALRKLALRLSEVDESGNPWTRDQRREADVSAREARDFRSDLTIGEAEAEAV